MVVEDVNALEEDRIGAAEVVEFVLLLVAEHALGVATGEFDLGIADAIGCGLVSKLAVVLGATQFEVTVVVVKGQNLVREACPVQVSEGEMGQEVLRVGFQGPVEAFAGVVPAALVRPAEPILEIALASQVACGAVQPIATGENKSEDEENGPEARTAGASARSWVR